MQKLYRFTTNGEGVFSAGKRLLPENLVDQANEARKWLFKPAIKESTAQFFFTQKGRDKYLDTLRKVHDKYLPNIQEEMLENIQGSVLYQDEWQVVIMPTR